MQNFSIDAIMQQWWTIQTLSICLKASHNKRYPSAMQEPGLLTSFWFGEAFVQVENNFLHKVLDVAVLWSTNKHHPVVGEAFHCGFLSNLGTMTKF